MAKESTKVCYLVFFNLILCGLLCLSLSLNYMSFTPSLALAYRTATYHFTYQDDPSMLTATYDSFSANLCPHSELTDLTSLCNELDVFKKAGVVSLLSTAGSLVFLAYITAYLVSIALQSDCATTFKPDIAHILLLFSHTSTFVGPFLIADFFTWQENGVSEWKAGLTLLCVIWVLVVMSGAYLVWLMRGVIPVLERGINVKYHGAIRPLQQPLISPKAGGAVKMEES